MGLSIRPAEAGVPALWSASLGCLNGAGEISYSQYLNIAHELTALSEALTVSLHFLHITSSVSGNLTLQLRE